MSRLPCLQPDTPDWFEDGVRFRCLGPECGACCSGQSGPGVVWVSREDVERLAEHLGPGVWEVRRRYLRRLDGRDSLREHANYDCVFYRPGTGCTVYEGRPLQCRTYPFWGRVTASRTTWEIEAESCPGIGCDDTRVSAEEIRRQLNLDQVRQPT
ncbi:MAG: YkgJ family cysteine cluster protein [bacterium]|nr:YkgJ family cysteine cluster protein [bacterium]